VVFLEVLPPAAMGEATGGPGSTTTAGPAATATAGTGATAPAGTVAMATGGHAETATCGAAASATGCPAATAATAPVLDGEETPPADSGPRLRLDWQEAPMHGECLPPPKARVPAGFLKICVVDEFIGVVSDVVWCV
jgi:hypothetical protein